VADMLAAGASWLSGQLQAAAGRTVTYQRGNEAADITATVGRSQFEAANQSGIVEAWESRDYLIPRSELPFGEPQRGDRILDELEGEIVTYEVGAPRGIPVVHYDPFRIMARIHSTLTDGGVVELVTEAGDLLTTEAGELLVV
jgi:hypothetical protein